MDEANPQLYCEAQHIDDLIDELTEFACFQKYKNKDKVSLNRRQVEMLLSWFKDVNEPNGVKEDK